MAILALIPALVILGSTGAYSDPGGAFALNVPDGWNTNRADLGDGLALTEFAPDGDEPAGTVTVFVQSAGRDIESSQHKEISDSFIQFLMGVIEAEGTVKSQKRSEVTFDGKKADQVSLTYVDEDGTSFSGRITVVSGKRHAMAVIAYAKAGDAKHQKLVADVEASFAVESRTPRSGGSGGGLFTKESLKGAAGAIKGNFKRDSMGKVLVPGETALTYGSVANFVTVIEILFDIQFTETEFLATQDRFIEFYQKGDGEGKRILALQGAELLKTLTSGTADEREQSRLEGKAVFENAFRNGAAQGIGYAQVMWDAISRRSNQLAKAKSAPTKDGWDQEISEGDVDATMEMLYFMWIASGRPAEEATPEAIMQIRMQIIENLPTMDAQLQMLIANAPKIYAGLRQQWAAASLEQRLAYSQQFSACLTEWGIGASGFEQSGGGGGGGGGNGEYGMNAQIAMNTAWNSAKTWSSGG